MFAHKILREKTHSTGCVSDGDRSPPSRSQGSRCGQMTGGTSSASPTRGGEAQPSEVKGGQAENQQPRRELIMWRVSCGRPGSWKGLRASFLLLLSPANPWVCLCLTYPTTGSVCLEPGSWLLGDIWLLSCVYSLPLQRDMNPSYGFSKPPLPPDTEPEVRPAAGGSVGKLGTRAACWLQPPCPPASGHRLAAVPRAPWGGTGVGEGSRGFLSLRPCVPQHVLPYTGFPALSGLDLSQEL